MTIGRQRAWRAAAAFVFVGVTTLGVADSSGAEDGPSTAPPRRPAAIGPANRHIATRPPHRHPPATHATTFEHVGTFDVPDNLRAGEDSATPTSAEIVDVTSDGRTLVYTDALTERLGFVDISDPRRPRPGGSLDFDGSPTSVAVVGPWALVAIDTSESYTDPSGELAVVRVDNRRVVAHVELAGQPDSIAVSPDHRYAAVVIENQRDEDHDDGLLPQPPGGTLQVIRLGDEPRSWRPASVDLSGLAEIAPSDPEPEYVDINADNRAVVSLQENNHLAVVDLRTASVVTHFSAGSTPLDGVDATEEELGPQEAGVIELDDSIGERRREPDAVAWIDRDSFVTANEGDYEDASGVEGGSRSFTVFGVDGVVEYESGNRFEHELVRAGHYPESRSSDKGTEPEGVEVGVFGRRRMLFVGSERANAVAVYDITSGAPRFVHVLPTGIGPEGLKAIPERGLLAASAEVDGMDADPDEQFPARPLITLYRAGAGHPSYPQVVSASNGGAPIPWTALSGLSADPHRRDTLWAASDSYLAQSWIYRIDTARRPAVITRRIAVGGPDGSFDLEGIAAREEGGFWVASEGLGDADRRNVIVRVGAGGRLVRAPIGLPDSLAANETSSGFEGIAVTGSRAEGDETVWVAVQREWPDDPAGMVKIGRYDVADRTWSFAHYPLDDIESPAGGWVGLSELTALPDGRFAIVERDNQLGPDARIKRIYRVDLAAVDFTPYGEALPVVRKRLLADVLDDLDANSITVPDKLEGLAAPSRGHLWLATDNDGVDENFGETLLFDVSQ